jgi:hypothetical protein
MVFILFVILVLFLFLGFLVLAAMKYPINIYFHNDPYDHTSNMENTYNTIRV